MNLIKILYNHHFQYGIALVIHSILFYVYSQVYFESVDARNQFFKLKYPVLISSLSITLFIYLKCLKNKAGWNVSTFYLAMNLFFSVFFVYVSSTQILTSKDTHPAKVIPFALESNQSLHLDDYISPLYLDGSFHIDTYYAIPLNNSYYSSYPILPGIFNYIILKYLRYIGADLPNGYFDIDNIQSIDARKAIYLEKYSASIYAAICSGILFLILKHSYSLRLTVLSVILFSFATSHYSNSSQTLWQHGFIELIILTGILFLQCFEKPFHTIAPLILGTTLLIRPTSILLVLFLFLYYHKKIGWDWKFYSLFLLSLLCAVFINYSIYNDPLGGYKMYMSYAMGDASLYVRSFDDYVIGLYGLLFSPGFGFFVFSPFFILVLLHLRMKFLILYLGITSYVLLYAAYTVWWGGYSYGARFLTDINPLMIIIAVPTIQHAIVAFKNRIHVVYLTLFWILVILSIYIQNLPTRDVRAFNLWHQNHKSDNPNHTIFSPKNSPILVEIFGEQSY